MTRALLFLAGAALCAAASAQQFPSGPVTIVNPYPPGGMGDTLPRLMTNSLTQSLGVPIIVESKPGANGAIGTAGVARAKPDGQTLGVAPMSTLTINPWVYKDIGYQPLRDLAPIMVAIRLPSVLIVHPSVQATTLREFIELLKKQPGALNYASMGQGSSGHLLAELFQQQVSAQITHVPYKGSGQAQTDLLSGKVQIMFENLPVALPNIRAGKMRGLGVTSAAASPQAPDIPPISSVIPGFEATIWFAFFAPAGTPKEVVAKLNEHMAKAMRSPEVTKQMEDRGATVVAGSPEDAARTIAADLEKWGKVVKDAKLTVQ
jgi:tripartite-type tricarboxylate transporter receptor subunit TctC